MKMMLLKHKLVVSNLFRKFVFPFLVTVCHNAILILLVLESGSESFIVTVSCIAFVLERARIFWLLGFSNHLHIDEVRHSIVADRLVSLIWQVILRVKDNIALMLE